MCHVSHLNKMVYNIYGDVHEQNLSKPYSGDAFFVSFSL